MSFEPVKKESVDDLSAMVREYLTELAGLGGAMVDCPENVNYLLDAIVSLETEEFDGAYVYVPDVGFALALAIPDNGFVMRYGRAAAGFGTYVREAHRKQGWSKKLRAELYDRLLKAGFSCVLGGADIGNTAGISSMDALGNAERLQILYRVDLHEGEKGE